MRMKEYTGAKRNEISFPLGGIGSGCIGLGGDGRFREWEIFNRPNKGALNGFSHFAIKAEREGRVLDARVLHTDLKPPFTGEIADKMFSGFGHGPYRETMSGIPHFPDGVFRAAYPFAELSLADGIFPGSIVLTAFNPLIPLREDDSSIPAAFFEISVANPTDGAIDYTVALSVGSPFCRTQGAQEETTLSGRRFLHILRTDTNRDDLAYGGLCAGTDAGDTSVQQYWFRGRWFDNLSVFWQNFTAPGRLRNRVYTGDTHSADHGAHDTGTLAAHIRVEGGQAASVRFVIAWYYPNCTQYLDPQRVNDKGEKQWKNYYASLYGSALEAADDALRRWDELYSGTRRFADAFFSQSLPEPILDAVSANISTLKSPTVLRLSDGSLYGWEGAHCRVGSCEGSCTHVWNYAYAPAFLFPRLQRSMRELDYRYNQDENGGMRFRLQLPLGAPRSAFRPCCDGQFGGIILTYREWKLSGDDAWLRGLWPAVRKSLEFAWSPKNEDRWDADADGVLEGRQHHTLDMELFGPNAWLTSLYLAALKAAAEMAEHLGEHENAAKYRALLARGSVYTDERLFNGEYYAQQIDLEDSSLLDPFQDSSHSLQNDSVLDAYWNDEAGEIKYQIGDGCEIDQVLGQWHAQLCGLGPVLRQENVRKALQAIYRHNYKADLRLFVNPCRLYYMPDERATVVCHWPEGRRRPVIPIPYAEESFTGMEYQAASHMICAGMYGEALELVQAVRDRYDGERRNPWNEIECGSNYARAMSSYALLLAVSGFRYDMGRGILGFLPQDPAAKREYFWSVDSAWGVYAQSARTRTLRVLAGEIRLTRLETDQPVADAALNGQPVRVRGEGNTAVFEPPLALKSGDALILS